MRKRPYLLWGEGVVLLVATPWLLFPTLSPSTTVFMVSLILFIWLAQRLALGQPLFPSTPMNWPLGLWGVMLLVGVGVSPNLTISLPKAAGLFLGFALWRYLALMVRGTGTLVLGLLGLSALGAIFALVGIFSANWQFEVGFVQALFGRLPPQLFNLPESPEAGIHTNQLAGTVVIYFPLALAALFTWRPARGVWLARPLALLLTILVGGLLIMTQSRGAWLAAVGGTGALMGLWFWSSPPSPRRRLLGGALLLAGLMLALGAAALGREGWEQLWHEPPTETAIGTLSTLAFRGEVWQWGLAALHDFPWTGVGLSTFREVVHRLYPIAVPESYVLGHAHNIFLQVGVDSGLPGLCAYLALIGTALGLALGCARRWPERRAAANALGASLITLHLYGILDALAPGSKTSLLFWMLLGLIAALPYTLGQAHAAAQQAPQAQASGTASQAPGT